MTLSKEDRAFIRRIKRDLKREIVAELRETLNDVLTEEARLVMLASVTKKQQAIQ